VMALDDFYKEHKMRGYGILKSTAAALILFGGLFSLVGCSGVSQEEFDRVYEDLDATRAQEQRISNDLAVAQSKVKDIGTELDDALVKLAEYSKIVETDYPDLSLRAEQARLLLAFFNELYRIGDTGDLDSAGYAEYSSVLVLFGQLVEIENPDMQQSVEYLFENIEYLSSDEAGEIVMGWLIEAERLLSK
jgi:hypothetical protein